MRFTVGVVCLMLGTACAAGQVVRGPVEGDARSEPTLVVAPGGASEGRVVNVARRCLKESGESATEAERTQVFVAEDGVHVAHAVQGERCLSPAVRVKVEPGVIRVRERFEARASRCGCASALETAVQVPSGVWTVVLELEEADRVRGVERVRVLAGALALGERW